MATFKVGQRVKVVSCAPGKEYWLGHETTIIGLPGSVPDYPLRYKLSSAPAWCGHYDYACASADVLAPLTDPGADAFMERIKKLGSEPVNTVEKEKVTR
jgi:hypothetical protein